MAGDLEDAMADALAEAAVRFARSQGALSKSGASEFRKTARQSAREVMGELVTPHLVRLASLAERAELASLAERIEWLEVQQADREVRYGGRGNG